MIGTEKKYGPGDIPVNFDDDLLRLIKGCIAKDRKAQRQLYDKYNRMVYGTIRKYENGMEAAEEILNDVFILVFTKLEQFSFIGSFEGWIRRITVNCITDHYRKNAKHKNVVSKEIEELNPYVESNVYGKLHYKHLLEIIHTLPETQRMVFNLFVFEELTHMEIAKTMNISEGYSKWYLNDARKRIKEKMNSMQ